ncbi:hybrid sensor histidine kinase/response regulator [Massilia eurypsychrophila]|uniref:Virulence sensor protein BvgS n=1 Tax=Massilia eurypsychrophila TaxID=1485217 RepID=A0A2G8TER5_9BURK|nr:response regulator [Massilia eurypsychrophila]PIL44542.1 hybrid sensor histidine kinase/response regulator [Massilia eurypsychrophila]
MEQAHEIQAEQFEVLIVEDSPTQAERLRRLIQSAGYRVRVASNGQRALNLIRERLPQLIVSDIVMPEMNGYDLCRALKADAALAAIPVILVTALNDAKDIIRGIESGADNFIRKPYSEDYLLNRIGQVLQNQRLRQDAGPETGIGVYLGEQKHFITASRQQMLDLLISTYEQAVQVNAELQARERQVVELNIRLSHHAAELEEQNREIAKKNLELAEASRMKSAFIANMSHELRTPLNAIIGFTGTLLMKLPGPLTVDQDKQLTTIRTSARHLLSLINDLLDMAKIEAGKVTLSLAPVQCQSLLVETVDSLRPLAAQKGLALTVEMPAEQIVVNSDQRALTQIVINLVNNAIKFTDQGAVRVTLGQRVIDGATVTEFSVADSGAGIRAEDQSKLFEAFSQLDSTSTRHAEGAGLGLYLCRNLAGLMGGSLVFSSQFGVGSTFTLRLPAASN